MRVVALIAAVALVGGMLPSLGCEDEDLRLRTARIALNPLKPKPACASIVDDDDNRVWAVHLCEVAIYSSETAVFEVVNPSDKPLEIYSVTLSSSAGTGGWKVVSHPVEVLPDIDRRDPVYIIIQYSPQDEWQDTNGNYRADPEEMDRATFTVLSNADAVNKEIDFQVDGWGVFRGAPAIEVCFGDYCGPDVQLECASGVCTTSRVLDFGNIGLGTVGTKTITVKNTADCPRPAGSGVCDLPELCKLTLARDAEYYDLGLGFEPGTNELERFKPRGSMNVPVGIPQEPYGANACGEDAYIRLRIDYNAPNEEAEDSAVFVIESNDPESPLIKIPLLAKARNAPVAICDFRRQDPLNPTGPWTDPSHIKPLDRVYFDGGSSFDPANPANSALITDYQWEVITYPPGTNPLDFQPHGNGTRYYDFWLPLAGFYALKLRVTNNEFITSGDTQDAICEFEVIPGSRMHIQLVWDDPVNDQDLHLVWMDRSNQVCNKPYDCYYSNKTPSWFTAIPAANPRLDIDDTNGSGPENINIDEPQAGLYRVFVHYYADHNTGSTVPTRNTVRIYLNGLQVAEFRRTLTVVKHLWAVADITWVDNYTNFATPLMGDAAGATGWLCVMGTCASPGYVCNMP